MKPKSPSASFPRFILLYLPSLLPASLAARMQVGDEGLTHQMLQLQIFELETQTTKDSRAHSSDGSDHSNIQFLQTVDIIWNATACPHWPDVGYGLAAAQCPWFLAFLQPALQDVLVFLWTNGFSVLFFFFFFLFKQTWFLTPKVLTEGNKKKILFSDCVALCPLSTNSPSWKQLLMYKQYTHENRSLCTNIS